MLFFSNGLAFLQIYYTEQWNEYAPVQQQLKPAYEPHTRFNWDRSLNLVPSWHLTDIFVAKIVINSFTSKPLPMVASFWVTGCALYNCPQNAGRGLNLVRGRFLLHDCKDFQADFSLPVAKPDYRQPYRWTTYELTPWPIARLTLSKALPCWMKVTSRVHCRKWVTSCLDAHWPIVPENLSSEISLCWASSLPLRRNGKVYLQMTQQCWPEKLGLLCRQMLQYCPAMCDGQAFQQKIPTGETLERTKLPRTTEVKWLWASHTGAPHIDKNTPCSWSWAPSLFSTESECVDREVQRKGAQSSLDCFK